eukprot:1789218-Prymnesium_polylepis.1
MQLLAINSLAPYAACAHAFAVIAPRVPHRETKVMCNLTTYSKRMWCRAENLCHVRRASLLPAILLKAHGYLCCPQWMHQGAESRWLAEEEGSCARLPADSDFLATSLCVFQGEASKESDKLTLVRNA